MKAANETKHIVHPVLRVSVRFMHFDSSSNVCYSFTITPCFNKSVVCVGVSLITPCIRFCVCPHGSCTLTLDPMTVCVCVCVCVTCHNHILFQRECCMRWCVIDAVPFHIFFFVLNTARLKHFNTTLFIHVVSPWAASAFIHQAQNTQSDSMHLGPQATQHSLLKSMFCVASLV